MYLGAFLLEFSKIVLFLVDLVGELMSLVYEEIDFLLEIVDLVLAFFLLLVLLFVAFCAHFEQAVDVERSLALFQVDELILWESLHKSLTHIDFQLQVLDRFLLFLDFQLHVLNAKLAVFLFVFEFGDLF